MGAQPEPYVRAFLDRLIPNPSELEHRSARDALARGQFALAEEALGNALALDPANDGARLDMAALLLARDALDAARRHFSVLSPRALEQSTYASVRVRIEAAETAATLPPADLLERRIAFDANDLKARLELAKLRIAKREFEPALAQLLEIVRRDRTLEDDVGRRKMLEVFVIAADQGALVDEYRRKLSLVLF
jgi:putative thioredoxin